MGELAVRLGIVLVAGLVVAILAFALKRRRARPARIIAFTGLGPGTYLFTSASCAECSRARVSLDDFTEISWEEKPEVFNRLGVSAVPSTLVVDSTGAGAWQAWPPASRNP